MALGWRDGSVNTAMRRAYQSEINNAPEGEDQCRFCPGGSQAGRAVLLGAGLLYETYGHREGLSDAFLGQL